MRRTHSNWQFHFLGGRYEVNCSVLTHRVRHRRSDGNAGPSHNRPSENCRLAEGWAHFYYEGRNDPRLAGYTRWPVSCSAKRNERMDLPAWRPWLLARRTRLL